MSHSDSNIPETIEPLSLRAVISSYGGPSDAAIAMGIGLRKMERIFSGHSRCPPGLERDLRNGAPGQRP